MEDKINLMALEMWHYIDNNDINHMSLEQVENDLDLIQNKYIN